MGDASAEFQAPIFEKICHAQRAPATDENGNPPLSPLRESGHFRGKLRGDGEGLWSLFGICLPAGRGGICDLGFKTLRAMPYAVLK